MPLATGERTAARCQNRETRAPTLGRLVWLAPAGKALHAYVCRSCYAQLQRQQKATIRR